MVFISRSSENACTPRAECTVYLVDARDPVLLLSSEDAKSELREDPADPDFDRAHMHYLDARITYL